MSRRTELSDKVMSNAIPGLTAWIWIEVDPAV